MDIQLVIPAWNAARWVGDAIASVLAQTHAAWRLLVVDDGSTDKTADVVARFADRRISLIRQPNAGVSAARNAGIRWGSGDPAPGGVLFLDADDRLAPDALARLVAALSAAPGAVAACGACGFSDGRTLRAPPAGDLLPGLLVRNLFANGGHLLLRGEAVRAAGEFRPDISYGEDWEYWIRVALQGPFATVAGRAPVLFVRRHAGGAYRRLAADPAAFVSCMAAMFGNPAVLARFGQHRLAAIRRRADAENAWIIGRELLRHGEVPSGRSWLRRSVAAAPGARRAALLALAHLLPGHGPFARYAVAGRENLACSEPTSPCGRKMMNSTSRLP
ncbi:MAG: glycosyltransferase family A protein [Acetobacteraceae bacterium]